MRKQIGRWGWFVLLVVALTATSVVASPDNDNDTDGWLTNGGFEGGWISVGAGQVAEGWTRVQLEGNANWMSTCIFANAGPGCDQHHVEKIAGVDSQIIMSEDLQQGQPFNTVLYQTVSGLVPGEVYSLSAYTVKMWGGSANIIPPDDPYSFGSRLGIDPWGGSDPTAPSVEWGDWNWDALVTNRLLNQRTAARAQGPSVTVFVQFWMKWQKPESQAILDAVELWEGPTATLHTPDGYLTTPHLDWDGTAPLVLRGGSPFELVYRVQRYNEAEARWVNIARDILNDSVALPLVEGEWTQLRVVPITFQSAGWPPAKHTGLPTESVWVNFDPTPPIFTDHLYLPTVR